MSPFCEERRSEIALALGEARPWTRELEEHLNGCSECASFVERSARSIEALTGLSSLEAPAELSAAVEYGFTKAARGDRAVQSLEGLGRLPVPSTLDGRVVASTQAGHRQDRAVEHLSSLPALKAPQALSEAVLDQVSEQAPEGLRGRVELELHHPELGVGNRLARHLSFKPAPAQLDARVDWTLRNLDLLEPKKPLRWVSGALLAAAASLAIWFGMTATSSTGAAPQTYSFSVVDHDSPEDLSPFAREMVNGATGGFAEMGGL